ncbi:hypothetical protein HGA88_03740 [Candidatus Roizmanbacteria bacterium]|nr:hypothetical protein [Candidatus Roizmanbacteria bacterium]
MFELGMQMMYEWYKQNQIESARTAKAVNTVVSFSAKPQDVRASYLPLPSVTVVLDQFGPGTILRLTGKTAEDKTTCAWFVTGEKDETGIPQLFIIMPRLRSKNQTPEQTPVDISDRLHGLNKENFKKQWKIQQVYPSAREFMVADSFSNFFEPNEKYPFPIATSLDVMMNGQLKPPKQPIENKLPESLHPASTIEELPDLIPVPVDEDTPRSSVLCTS